MEGLGYNYKDEWCLDSQVIFDELGFCWDLELRPGSTKSGVGASEQSRYPSYEMRLDRHDAAI